jgi:hypothetical protein
MCPGHSSKKAKFFCVNCSGLICSACFINHKLHEVVELEAYLSSSLDAVYRQAQETETYLSNRHAEASQVSALANQSIAKATEELEAAYKQTLEELNRDFKAGMEAIRTANEFNQANSEQEVKPCAEMLVRLAEVSKGVLGLKHSYSQPAERFEQLQRMKHTLASAEEGWRDKLQLRLGSFQKVDRPASCLGRLAWNPLLHSLAAKPRPAPPVSRPVGFSPTLPAPPVREPAGFSPSLWSQEPRLAKDPAVVEPVRSASFKPSGRGRSSVAESVMSDFADSVKNSCSISSIESSVQEAIRDGRSFFSGIFGSRSQDQMTQSSEEVKQRSDRQASRPNRVKWSFMTNFYFYKAFPPEENIVIEAAYQQGRPSVDIRNHLIDFNLMEMINKRTGRRKGVRREVS